MSGMRVCSRSCLLVLKQQGGLEVVDWILLANRLFTGL